MFRQHWGDLPIIPDTESGIAALEREQITKPRALEIEGAKLHQLSQSSATPLEVRFNIDPLTLHTIQLLEHNKKLKALIQTVQEQQPHQDGTPRAGDNTDVAGDNLQAFTVQTPLLPTRPEPPPGMITDRHPGDVKHKIDNSDFVLGKEVPQPELPFAIVHQLLRKTVAVICAHLGYETSSELVLDTLTSVAHQYFFKMCSLLRVAVDREALTGSTGFVDPMEEVFHHMGLGSVTVLHHFYQTRVVSYHRHVLRACKDLETEFHRLSSPQAHRPTQDVKPQRLQVEDQSVCEIKFPVLDELEGGLVTLSSGGVAITVGPQAGPAQSGGGGDQSPPPLEELHGALQGIEGSTSLKEEAMKWLPPQVALRGKDGPDTSQGALDPDEIINVSDTPEPASGSEMEQMPPSVTCDPLTLSPASDPMVQFCKPPKKKKKK